MKRTQRKPKLAEVPLANVARTYSGGLAEDFLKKVQAAEEKLYMVTPPSIASEAESGDRQRVSLFNLKPGESGRQGEGKDGNRGRELQVILSSPCLVSPSRRRPPGRSMS